MSTDRDDSWFRDTDQLRGIGLTLLMVLSMIALSVPMLGVGATGVSAAATTITVDNSGGADYTSIQAAVDNAAAGDTVEVQPGTYAETVTVDKDITIVAPQGATLDNGASPDRTFPLNPERTNSAFVIGSQAAPTIEGFTIRNYRGAAIYAFVSTGEWTVRNVQIHNTSIGLGATQSGSAWVLDEVRIQDATVGIYAGDTTGAFMIRDSTLQSNRIGLGAFGAAGDWTVHNTTIADHPDIGISAIDTTGAWSIQESRFSGNHDAINATGATPAGSATHNWWGACDGPSGDYSGSGDTVDGDVAVKPYYTDAAQTTLSNETSTPCGPSGSFDFGVELWDPSATVSQGSDVTIGVAPNNNADQSVSGTTVELLVDTNDDGQFESSEVVASQSADFAANEYRRINLTYTDVQLSSGQYSYVGQISKDGQTTQSFTNGTLTVESDSSSGSFDFGVELWDPSTTVSQGDDVTIGVAPNNNADQPVSGTTVELLVDTNDDGQFESSEVVASQNADFAASEYRRINLTYTDVQLPPGQYSYVGQISKDGQTTQSFTNGTLTVESSSERTTQGTTVYVGSTEGTLYAVNASTGEQTWAFTAPTGAVRSSPTVVNGTVYVGADDGTLYAVDASTGEQTWAFTTPTNPVRSSPTVVDGTVYVGTGDISTNSGTLYAVDAATGDQEWAFTDTQVTASSPTVVDGTVYVGSWNVTANGGALYAVDAATGDRDWTFAQLSGVVVSSPTVANGTVYIGADEVYAVDATTGTEEWTSTTPQIVQSSPTVVDGVVVVGTGGPTANNGTVYGIDAATGDQIAAFSQPSGAIASSPTVAQSRVYVGSHDGTLYAINTTTDSQAWTFTAPTESVQSSPTAADGTVYVGSDDGTLYAVDAASGSQTWAFTAPTDAVYSSPTVVKDPAAGHSTGSRVLLRTLGHHHLTGTSTTPSITVTDQTVTNGTSTITVDSANAGSDYYIEITDASGATLATTATFTAEQTDLTVDLGQTLTANTTLTVTVYTAADDTELATDTATITVTDETSGLPTQPGEPGFTDVLSVIGAFNTNEEYNGVQPGFQDVLAVIEAFNSGQ